MLSVVLYPQNETEIVLDGGSRQWVVGLGLVGPYTSHAPGQDHDCQHEDHPLNDRRDQEETELRGHKFHLSGAYER